MYIALDIGGTNIRLAAADTFENPIKKKEAFPNHNNFSQDFAIILTKIRQYGPIGGIGVGIAGQISEDGQIFLDAPNFPTWNNKPLVSLFSHEFSCSVVMQNDAVAGGYGEAVFGNNQITSGIYLIWGTGIGGAQIQLKNNKPFVEKFHWESYFPEWEKDCGGRVLYHKYHKPTQELSQEEWEVVKQNYIQHLSSFIQQTHPQHIIFSGGVAINNPQRIREIMQHFPTLPFSISTLGETANLLGAFYTLSQKLLS